MASNYPKIKSIILRLNQNELLRNRIIIVGGTVPYLVGKKESNREHSDIDIIVKQENMPFVREYLERKELPIEDSLELAYNKLRLDYGINAVIEGITVNFAPYELNGSTMVQKNFLTKQSSGMDALATVTMKNVNAKNIFIATSISGITVHTYSLEMVKIMKEKSKKEQDVADIKVIDDFGYDENIYLLLKEQLKDMKIAVKPRNKLLSLLFR